MKKYTFIAAALTPFLIFNCNENGVGSTPESDRYPAKLNMEWEYNTKLIIDYYDSTGNITNTDTSFTDNTVARIVSINDTLLLYTGLIKFECYDISNSDQKSYHWYSNSDSGLIIIAYMNAGANQVVIPKRNMSHYLTLDEFLSLANSPAQNLFSAPGKINSDSIMYYDIPRKALAYPLSVNKRWVELVTPYYRERYVGGMKVINFNGFPINCYEIKTDWPGFGNMEFNDFINLNYGLVKREFLADSIMITSITNPDSGSFGRVSQVSNLVKVNSN